MFNTKLVCCNIFHTIMKNIAPTRCGMLLFVALAAGCAGLSTQGTGTQKSKGNNMSDTPSLFKGADPNTIGNTAQAVTAAASPAIAPDGYGQPKTVVKFQPAAIGGWRTVTEQLDQENDPNVLTASIFATPETANSGVGGPITGIALFASGGGNAQIVEFDIPVVTNNGPNATPFPQPFYGGTQISVPATSLEIRARNDARLIPNPIGGVANQQIGVDALSPTSVTGSIARGTKPTFARATKSVWLINRSAVVAAFVANDSGGIIIPPFATSVRVARVGGALLNTSAQIQIDIAGATTFDTITVAAGALCPEIILGGGASFLTITNTDGALTLRKIVAIFTLSI